jgi:hypothetical protein
LLCSSVSWRQPWAVFGSRVRRREPRPQLILSRSNKLMRLRVLVQFIAIILLVILGAVAGAFR